MQVTDEMVRVAVQAMKALEDKATEDPENIFGADLTSLARAALSAALAAMQDHVIVPKELSEERAVASGMQAKNIIFGGEGNFPTIFDAMKAIYQTMVESPAPSQLSKRGDAAKTAEG